MDDRTQGAMLLAVGGVSLRLGLTDAALAYVKAGLQPLLVAAGVVLVVLGAGAVLRAFRADGVDGREHPAKAEADVIHAHVGASGAEVMDSDDHTGVADVDCGHDHDGRGPRVAWLLVAPLLALLLIAPPPLGAFAAARQSTIPPVDTRSSYPPLPEPVDGAVELSVSEFVFRALYDTEQSLDGVQVRLTGFASGETDAEGWNLSRFVLSCCAADGRAVNVVMTGEDGAAPTADEWFSVEGTWQPRQGVEPGEPTREPPLFAVEQRTPIEAPAQPYEY